MHVSAVAILEYPRLVKVMGVDVDMPATAAGVTAGVQTIVARHWRPHQHPPSLAPAPAPARISKAPSLAPAPAPARAYDTARPVCVRGCAGSKHRDHYRRGGRHAQLPRRVPLRRIF